MQLEETASSKDVPPLSCTRGVFELPAFVAQNNLHLPISTSSQSENNSGDVFGGAEYMKKSLVC